MRGVNGLFVNAGHGHYGWGQSHGTAKLLVEKVMHKQTDPEDDMERRVLNMLSIDRF